MAQCASVGACRSVSSWRQGLQSRRPRPGRRSTMLRRGRPSPTRRRHRHRGSRGHRRRHRHHSGHAWRTRPMAAPHRGRAPRAHDAEARWRAARGRPPRWGRHRRRTAHQGQRIGRPTPPRIGDCPPPMPGARRTTGRTSVRTGPRSSKIRRRSTAPSSITSCSLSTLPAGRRWLRVTEGVRPF